MIPLSPGTPLIRIIQVHLHTEQDTDLLPDLSCEPALQTLNSRG